MAERPQRFFRASKSMWKNKLPSHMLVTVIIPTWNRKDDVMACVRSVVAQDYSDKEIIVFDNASQDGTAEAIETAFPAVHVVRNRENIGAVRARNEALELARGEFIWFLDSDVEILDPRCLTRMLASWKSEGNIGCMGGEGVFDDGGQLIGAKRVMLRPNGMPRGEVLLGGEPYGVVDADWLVTANLLTKLDYVRQIGGFDPWFRHFSEDQDLTTRIARLGWRNVSVRMIPVLHKYSASSRIIDLFLANKSRLYFAIKHFSWPRVFLLPVLDLLYFLNPTNVTRGYRYLKTHRSYEGTGRPSEEPKRSSAPLRRVLALLRFGVVNVASVMYAYLTVPVILTDALAARGRTLGKPRSL